MEVVIGTLPLWLYIGTGVATVVPFARYFRGVDKEATRKNRYHTEESFLYLAFLSWLASLAWPITGVVFGTAHILRADERKAEAARQHEMGLAEAFKIVEAQKQAEKTRHQKQLAAFDKALGIEDIPDAGWRPRTPKKTDSWQSHVRSVAKRDKLYPFDN